MPARRRKRTAGGKDNKGLTGKAYKALLRKQALAGLTKVIASVVQFFAQRRRRKSKTNTDDF